MLDHADVVADEQIRKVQTVPQIKKQVYDLGLNGHVQRGHRFVTHYDARIDSQRARNANPLTLPPGKLMRIAIQRIFLQTDAVERLDREGACLGPLDQLVGNGSFGDRINNALAWVQCGGGILKDHLNAQTRACLLLGLVRHGFAVEQDITGIGRQNARHKTPERGLPTAGFAHKPQHFALLYRQINTIHGLQHMGGRL